MMIDNNCTLRRAAAFIASYSQSIGSQPNENGSNNKTEEEEEVLLYYCCEQLLLLVITFALTTIISCYFNC